MKTFGGDFDLFLNKIKNGEHFSLSRWGDGELMILEGVGIDIRAKGNGEFRYNPNLTEYDGVRNKLLESYLFVDKNYYIGVACACCVGNQKYQYMKQKCGQSEEYLTWANIFVNANYRRTIAELIPELNNHVVNLVVNNNSNFSQLPFKYKKAWTVGADAWLNNYNLIDELIRYIRDNEIKNELFLFAAGPFANILTYELWKNGSKENTYIDIGSILEPHLQLKITRGYHMGAPELNKVCIW